MADHGILYSPAMVRALLAGTKTQTRRLPVGITVNLQISGGFHVSNAAGGLLSADAAEVAGFIVDTYRYEASDRLYVREAWRCASAFDSYSPSNPHKGGPVLPATAQFSYEADNPGGLSGKFRQGMHMPRWMSRLTLEVVEVKAERLQDISEADALAEGVTRMYPSSWRFYCGQDKEGAITSRSPITAYAWLWDSLNLDRASWASNPWVVATVFKVHRCNIDEMEKANA